MDIRKTPFGSLLMLSLMSGAPIVDETVTGNPVTFETTLARPLKSLIARFLPVQEGSGDPSPENVRNISGWTGLNVWHGGKNLLDPETLEQGGINTDGTNTSNPKRIRSGYIPVKENAKYFLSAGDEYKLFLHFYDSEKTSIGSNVMNKATAPSGACFARAIIGYQDEADISPSDVTTGQFELGTTATAFEPYKPITKIPISFPSGQTIFGGSLDLVSGEVWATSEFALLNNPDKWIEANSPTNYAYDVSFERETGSSTLDLLCSCFPVSTTGESYCRWRGSASKYFGIQDTGKTLEQIKEIASNGNISICYKISPVLIDTLTPEQIRALIGNNTIWSDGSGDCSVTFQKKG